MKLISSSSSTSENRHEKSNGNVDEFRWYNDGEPLLGGVTDLGERTFFFVYRGGCRAPFF